MSLTPCRKASKGSANKCVDQDGSNVPEEVLLLQIVSGKEDDRRQQHKEE